MRALVIVVAALLVVAAAAVVVAFAIPRQPAPTAAPTQTRAFSARIFLSVPRGGARRSQSEGLIDAVRLAVDEVSAHVTAGSVTYFVDVDARNSATDSGDWSADLERANAQAAVTDPSVVAYIGPSTPDAARVVAPILAPGDLFAITPTITNPALTQRGWDDGLYEAVHPGGERVFVRTIPSDAVAGRAMARYALDRKFMPSTVAKDAWSQAFTGAVSQPPSGGTPFVYLGGLPAAAAADQLRQLRAANPGMVAGGAESILSDTFIERAGDAATGVVATFAGRPAEQYSGAASAFERAYVNQYVTAPDPYAIFGYDAARLVLDALARSQQTLTLDRAKVRDQAFATRELDGALGAWGVDPNGDTTYATEQLYVVRALPDGKLAWLWDSEIRP